MSSNTLIIYKSSAGSGKTYTLVLEYLKLVLKKPTLYRSILAITFTNKATEEMKTRIVNSLIEIVSGKNVELMKVIQAETGLPVEELPARAEKVLEFILHDYSGFSVSTIDSFFSKMVRSLARELHLSMRFDLELDSSAVAVEITDMLFNDISENKQLRRWLEEYIISKLDDEKSWKLDNEIHAIARNLFDEKYRKLFPEGSKAPDPEFIGALRKIKSDFEKEMQEIGLTFLKVISENNLTVDDFSYKSAGVAGYFPKLVKILPYDEYKPKDRFLAAAEDSAKWVSKSSPNAAFIINLAESTLIPLAQKAIEKINSSYAKYTGAVSVLENAYMAGIIGTLDEKLKIFRSENDVVLISDNNTLLRKAIEGTDAPFIYEKSGNKFTHFMLDEFQDTSDFQWNNLLPLIENALGSGHYTLVVGDAKQSIYRWRGGNMKLLQNEIQEDLKAFEDITSNKNLDSNYRSRAEIVKFNNRFFETAPQLIDEVNLPGQQIHPFQVQQVIQKWKKGKDEEGFVRVKFFDDVKAGVDKETGEIIDDVKWKNTAASETLETINKLLADGFRKKDIALLIRSNSEAKEITAFLLANGISDIISPESMQLNRSPRVLFMVSLFTFINDYSDDIALSHVVYYLNIIKKKNYTLDLHDLFAAPRKTKLALLPSEFSNQQTSFRKLPLYEAAEELSSLFQLNDEPDAFMQQFSDVIIEYSRNHPSNISDFLNWWDENQEKEACSVIIPSRVDAIKVMTIHKSKGLQFPVVIMPFADWKMISDHKTSIWVSSDEKPFDSISAHPVKVKKILADSIFQDDYSNEVILSYVDNLNLMYVAFTRAEEQLYIFTKTPSKNKADDDGISFTSKLIEKTIRIIPEWGSKFEDNTFEIGVYSKPLYEASVKSDDNLALTKWISTPWKDRLHMAVSKNKIASTDPELHDINYGIHFHTIIATIENDKDFANKIESYVSENKIDSAIRARLETEIKTFVGFATERNWFDENSETINETEILLNDGSILRPDRLIVKDKKVIVIDYKTGKEEKFHKDQVKNYADALKQMGYEEAKIFLVYPSLEKVVEVTAA